MKPPFDFFLHRPRKNCGFFPYAPPPARQQVPPTPVTAFGIDDLGSSFDSVSNSIESTGGGKRQRRDDSTQSSLLGGLGKKPSASEGENRNILPLPSDIRVSRVQPDASFDQAQQQQQPGPTTGDKKKPYGRRPSSAPMPGLTAASPGGGDGGAGASSGQPLLPSTSSARRSLATSARSLLGTKDGLEKLRRSLHSDDEQAGGAGGAGARRVGVVDGGGGMRRPSSAPAVMPKKSSMLGSLVQTLVESNVRIVFETPGGKKKHTRFLAGWLHTTLTTLDCVL